ncbi:MAG: hypothetical protein FJX75_16460 [Armatimonadetes bacterium]|nr:hypothetical protein [Armatimonadota bacterium]
MKESVEAYRAVLRDNIGWLVTLRTELDALVWARFQYFLTVEAGLFGLVVLTQSGRDIAPAATIATAFIGALISAIWVEFTDRGDRSFCLWRDDLRIHHEEYLSAQGIEADARPWLRIGQAQSPKYDADERGPLSDPRLCKWVFRRWQPRLPMLVEIVAEVCAIAWIVWALVTAVPG